MKAILTTLIALYEGWLAACPAAGRADLAKVIAELKRLPDPQPVVPRVPMLVHQQLPRIVAQAANTPYADLLNAIAAVADQLDWITMPPDYLGEAFVEQFAYVRLAGPPIAPNRPTMFPSSMIKFGLSLQAPNLFYASHWHEAVEFYGILSGTARWQHGKRPFSPQPPTSFIYHESNLPHAMQTEAEPLLTTYAWVGEIEGAIKTAV